MAEEKGVIRTISKFHLQKAEKITWNTTKGSAEIFAVNELKVYGLNGLELSNYKNKPINMNSAEVEEIKLITILEDGCDWKNQGTLRKGIIIDRIYEFEVIKFRNNISPLDYNLIKWYYRYEGKYGIVDRELQNNDNNLINGKRILINLKHDLDVCGRGITIYAYIQNKESGAALNIWVHYRFRFFSREIIRDEITARIEEPALINQNHTSLCGMVCIFYFLAKYYKNDYRDIALELHQKGIVKYNNYTIKPDLKMYDVNPTSDLNYPAFRQYSNGASIIPPDLMPLIDWITMASIRNAESSLGYTGKDGQDFSAINYPFILIKLLKQFLKYGEVIDYTDFSMNPGGGEMLGYLIEMQKAYQTGYKISILIDSDMLNNRPTYLANFTRWHWIIYAGDIYIDEKSESYTFSYVCWGSKNIKKTFNRNSFNSNFYGYIKAK